VNRLVAPLLAAAVPLAAQVPSALLDSARTQHDLFLAQGFVAAQDRLWQMETWRRAGEGRLAEVHGPAFVERDCIARALRYQDDEACARSRSRD
jgi:Penicillin amidase